MTTELTQGDLVALAAATAIKYGLDPALICAICEQESGNRKPDPVTGREDWNMWANRNEPGFDSKYIKPLHLSPTEEVNRSQSWGLMQLMGESVRELGYHEVIPKILWPSYNIDFGCRWFKVKLDKAGGNVNKALLLWNGGGDPTYDTQVTQRMKNYSSLSVPASQS